MRGSADRASGKAADDWNDELATGACAMTRRPNLLLDHGRPARTADAACLRALPGADPASRPPRRARRRVSKTPTAIFPLCAPARVSMLSGRLPSRIGAFDNAVEFPASVPTLHHYLRLAGYRTCLAGKMHFIGPDQLHGYEERVNTDVYPANFLWTPDWRLDDESWLDWYHSMRAVLDAGPHRRSVNVAYDDETEFESVRWLHEHADSGDDRPFALTVSFISPHDPYLAAAVLVGAVPGRRDRSAPGRGHCARGSGIPTAGGTGSSPGATARRVGENDILRMRRAYCAVTSHVDAKVGKLLETLEAIGAAGDTVVVFTSGPRRLARRARLVLQDVVLRMVGSGAADRARTVRVHAAAGVWRTSPTSISSRPCSKRPATARCRIWSPRSMAARYCRSPRATAMTGRLSSAPSTPPRECARRC